VADKQSQESRRAASLKARKARHAESLARAKDALTEVARSLKGRVGIYVRTSGFETNAGLSVAVGRWHPFIARPLSEWRVTPDSSPHESSDAEQSADSTCRYTAHEVHQGYGSGHETLPLVGIVSMVEQAAATFLANPDAHAYKAPAWYSVLGKGVGGLLFALVWILCVSVWGLGGLALGWIPAALTYQLAVVAWGPMLLLGLGWWLW
jgi:hypothetical protein